MSTVAADRGPRKPKRKRPKVPAGCDWYAELLYRHGIAFDCIIKGTPHAISYLLYEKPHTAWITPSGSEFLVETEPGFPALRTGAAMPRDRVDGR